MIWGFPTVDGFMLKITPFSHSGCITISDLFDQKVSSSTSNSFKDLWVKLKVGLLSTSWVVVQTLIGPLANIGCVIIKEPMFKHNLRSDAVKDI